MNAPAFIPPSARDEAWRLSPLRGWDFATYSAPALPLITMPNKPDWADQHVALVNGAPSASHSLVAIEAAPDALGAAALTAPGGEGAFAAWAGETAQGILDLSTLGPTVLLSLYAAGEGVLAANWLRLRVPAGQEFTLVEELRGKGTHLLNTRLEILLDPGARLRHIRIQDQSLRGFSVGSVWVQAAKDAHYHSTAIALGAGFARHEIAVELLGGGARADLTSANLASNMRQGRGQHLDTTSYIHHAVADTQSNALTKSLLAKRGRAVFQGKIRVAPNAQKISGHQLSRGLMLSEQADLKVKPELEIFADDVVCSHGATIGVLDDTQLFYLRSRGIPEAQARQLLVQSFLAEVLEGIALAPVRQALDARLALWLETQT